MEPTLHTGQLLTINKLAYLNGRRPQRGEIIVYDAPPAPDRTFIHRIIGLPGEKVEVRDSQVYINDRPLPEPYRGTAPPYTWGPSVVSAGAYFVLGDNRGNSSDSHSWGFLPQENITGKAWFSYWPPAWWGAIPQPDY